MFKLTIVTPEKRILVGQEVEEVTVPAFKGELNILPGHAPLITTLETGVMKWKLKGKERQETAVISWGYCQVSPEGVNILANIADLPEEIDLEMTKAYLAESEKKVMNEVITDEDWVEFQREWARARAKIEVASQAKK
ncbi:ATP synthase F1 subunit epsilon [Bdellovibrio bacteriovorus]|uniref:ATP synthase epsilon chain n=1 Tax=Bdellovibrio bacteriovorus TaxID=959 RepID=A0A150WWN1_BDEBC|nr:ATP synthase F1 subunit epsilon [Bdellovibrio bacteriovorus]KYG70853.1 ATP synthase subunit epsilon [Bdellovibrio bacteriovorus]